MGYHINGFYKKTGKEYIFSEPIPISLHNLTQFKNFLTELEKDGDFWVDVEIKYYKKLMR